MAYKNLRRKSNSVLVSLIHELNKKSSDEKVSLWKAIAEDLCCPSRKRRIVNLCKLSKMLQDNEIAIVPGKVLGVGEIGKKVTVAAFSFSKEAADKINKSGKAISISELMKQNPKAENVRIIG